MEIYIEEGCALVLVNPLPLFSIFAGRDPSWNEGPAHKKSSCWCRFHLNFNTVFNWKIHVGVIFSLFLLSSKFNSFVHSCIFILPVPCGSSAASATNSCIPDFLQCRQWEYHSCSNLSPHVASRPENCKLGPPGPIIELQLNIPPSLLVHVSSIFLWNYWYKLNVELNNTNIQLFFQLFVWSFIINTLETWKD